MAITRKPVTRVSVLDNINKKLGAINISNPQDRAMEEARRQRMAAKQYNNLQNSQSLQAPKSKTTPLRVTYQGPTRVQDLTPTSLERMSTNRAEAAIKPVTDIYQQNLNTGVDIANQRVSELQSSLQPQLDQYQALADQQKQALAARYQQRLLEAQENATKAREDTATRFAFSGFGRSDEHVGEQSALARQALNVENEIRREQLLQESLIDAQAKGASEDVLRSISDQISQQQQRVGELKAAFADNQANLRLKAMETGQASYAGIIGGLNEAAQLEQQKQADAYKQRVDFLASQGLSVDPTTGEVVENPLARADLLGKQADAAYTQAQTDQILKALNTPEILKLGRYDSAYTIDPETGQAVPLVRGAAPRGSGGGGGGSLSTTDNLYVQAILNGDMGLLDIPDATTRKKIEPVIAARAAEINAAPAQPIPLANVPLIGQYFQGITQPKQTVNALDLLAPKLKQNTPTFQLQLGTEPQ